ncbi:condensin complex subunit 2 isoform X2 [Rhodamnia argentea]|uniref:Condensin complex subunit 2 n=1 Tax=Rhodamnia argentea TaxID=178133 RepID=A0A8B8PXU6_9MYRT|nr:condensin complex subunit 2 isoform X2 [Rhodamnia argentea]
MAEIVSPRHRSIANRIQSPTSPFFLGSNDDDLERAQARAARAAAIRRKPVAAHPPPESSDADPGLGKQQILELFHNCIKLASENKINQKNTWELGLIDHLYEIIKVEEENDTETNFQKASCTLEAGVKIYSMRVDSVHSEAYKVLGGMNRAGQENEQDGVVEDPSVDGGQEECRSKRDTDKKISPLSTLEPSFEALNVKKFDVAFLVDPLYHQTSAQFDEGGAKGLLLNNLGVYGGCRVLFDSLEVPGNCMSDIQNDKLDTVDLSFAKECIEQMVLDVQMKAEITPTLRMIVDQFDEDNRRPTDFVFQKPEEQSDATCSSSNVFDGADTFENCSTWDQDDDNGDPSVVVEESNCVDPTVPSHTEENELFSYHDPDSEDKVEEVESYLYLGLGFNTQHNAWAGPDHWKFRKPKGKEEKHAVESGSPTTAKKTRYKKQVEVEIDFTSFLDKDMPDIFAPPKNPKSLLLPANRAPCNIRLPEDCHYQPESLVKLFLLPNVMCLGRKQKKWSDERRESSDGFGPSTSWDHENVFDQQFDDGNIHSDEEDVDTLVSQPRQVNKIEVQYDKTSKQVDVQALKETLWDRILRPPEMSTQDQEEAVSFKQILASFPADCGAAASIGEISPHLCFICLLHLANEHGLSILGCINMDDLSIRVPGHNVRKEDGA